MKLRTFTVMGVTGLTLLTAAAGYSANELEQAVLKPADTDVAELECMAEGFDTPEGRVGCFQPVIAIIDDSFFATDSSTEEDVSD